MRNKNKGFSFIELIIIVAILSIIMLMVSSIMSSTVSAYTRTNADNKVQATAQETYDRMANHIMMAQGVKIKTKRFDVYTKTIVTDMDGNEISSVESPSKGYVGFSVGKDIDELCNVSDDDITINSIGFLCMNNASHTILSGYNGVIVPFNYLNSTTVTKNATANEITTVIKYADLETNNLNVLYADNDYYYVARYLFEPPEDDGSTEGKIYLVIVNTNLKVEDEFKGTDAEKLVYKKAKLKFLGTFDNSINTEENLLCTGVENFHIITDGNGNSLGINMDFTKRNKKYDSKGMILIRNTNVLARPKNN